MHLLTCDLNNIEINKVNNIEFEIKQDSLNSEEEIQDFINEHKKVFRSAPYTIDKIKELREEEGFKNIAIYDNNHIVGNILLFIEEAEIKYGLIEDLFISKEYRKHGLGQYLVIRAVEYFKGLGLHETRVEVWSSNHRAHQLYSKAGFAFKQELEASIGMAI
jgi:GNAT superfamily N-acetyltransferase